jgi:hypothetical protein
MNVTGNKNDTSKKDPEVLFKKALGPLADGSLEANVLIVEKGSIKYSSRKDSSEVDQEACNIYLTINGVKVDSASAGTLNFINQLRRRQISTR